MLRVVVRKDIKWTEQYLIVIGIAIEATMKLNVLFRYMDAEMFKRIYPTYIKSHVETSAQAWCPYLLGDIDRLEIIYMTRGLGC